MKNFTFGIGLALFVCACEVDVVIEDGTTSSVTGTSSSKSSTASSSTSSSTTANTSASSSVGGSGGSGGSGGAGGGDTCTKMKSVLLSNVVLLDAGGDGVWSPGESASMQVTMSNDSFADNFDYPGFSVAADVPGVTSTGNTLFGLFGAQSIEVAFDVASDPAIMKGTDVTLTLTVTTLSAECSDLGTIEATFTLE